MLYNGNYYQNGNLEFLDLITIASFILQVQNREGKKIDIIRDEIQNRIEGKLDRIIQDLEYIKSRL